MKQLELVRALEKYPVFSLKNVRDTIKKESGYAKLVLFRLKKQGLIYELEKNKYTMHKDILVVASNIVWPSYLSVWTALRYYNLTEQLPKHIFVITTRARKKSSIMFQGTKINFIKTKTKFFFGFMKEKRDGFDIFIAEPEKALVDSVLYKKISFSEISSIIKEHLKEINVNRLANYLLKIKNKTLIKRFGFLLDKTGKDFFNKFKEYISQNYIALDYAIIKKGKKNKKWKVIENVKL